jgi:leucyl-tRNA synthetase
MTIGMIEDESLVIAVQINGKLRGEITISQAEKDDKDAVIKMAKENEKIQAWISGKDIIKEIYVPGKIVNIVLK